jgi:hypothetical protein
VFDHGVKDTCIDVEHDSDSCRQILLAQQVTRRRTQLTHLDSTHLPVRTRTSRASEPVELRRFTAGSRPLAAIMT